MWRVKRRGAHPQGEEADAAVVEFGEDSLGGDLLVHDQPGRPAAGEGPPVLGEDEHLVRLGGLGQVGVGVDEGVGGGVLGEEGEY